MSEYRMIDGILVFDDGRVYKPVIQKQGTIYTNFLHNNKRYILHRVVAEAFIPNPDGKPYVNHINGDTHDNRPENLEWVTPGENVAHAWATGLIPRRNTTKVRREKWTEIRKGRRNPLWWIRREKGVTQNDLANQLGVARSTVAMWETGKAIPSMDTITRISAILDCQIKDLL
jgi:DNA-binding XRE family transcriptional regulator